MSIREQLDPLFYPRSVALVGISDVFSNVGNMALHSLLDAGYENVYPVNPKGGKINGREVYTSIRDIPGEVDLAILTVPREAVPAVIAECAEKRVKGAVLYTGGFGETGEEGARLQEEIVRTANSGGTRIIGPNCLGPYNPSARLVLQSILPRENGPVAVISHSGFLFYYLLLSVAETGIMPGKGVSSGSDSDLTCVDFIDYFGEDPEIKVIVAYMEGTRDGKKLLRVARRVSARKPIIVLKAGSTEAGRKASASHTGTLAVPAATWKAICDQTGIISVETFQQMMDLVPALYHLPHPRGRRVGIVTTPGGLAVTAADACNDLGLEVPGLEPRTRRQLDRIVESVGTSVNNPVDLGMIGALSPERYMKPAIGIVGSDPNVDMILAAWTGPPFDDDEQDKRIAGLILDELANTGKPAVICGAVPQKWPRGELRFLDKSSVPVYPEPRRAAYALAVLARYSEFVRG